ncbi:MAG TPA: class I SAM-dependent methyltransferase, partial [Pseudonocardiaceae bacterium]|nr:class I SAM-dependent methyltransferase [Pseudonocardiaceae bacterium]
MRWADEQRWHRYLAGYHDQRPAITERLLTSADASPYVWLVEPLHDVDGPILDVACGSAPTRPLLAYAHWLGLDYSTGELCYAAEHERGPLVRARADALPVATNGVAAVCAAMCLQVLTPWDAVLGEITRVLRPGGRLAALVPGASGLNPAQLLLWARIMWWLGMRRQPWPNPQARDGLPRLLHRAGFTVRANARRTFTVPLATAADAELLIEGLYLPGVADHRVRTARQRLASLARPGRRVALPLRRVVAVHE